MRAAAVLTYRIGKLFFSKRVGGIAGYLYALEPYMIMTANLATTETVFNFLVLCFFMRLENGLSKSSQRGSLSPLRFFWVWPFHRVHFTPMSLEKLLLAAGFRMRSVDYVNPEYTISSLVQSTLNLFLPKNALYAVAANRRSEMCGKKTALVGTASLLLFFVISPILLMVFLLALATRRSAAMIAVAER